jgi:hypothetical protein
MWGVVLGFLFSILNNVKKLPTVTPQRARTWKTVNFSTSQTTAQTVVNVTGKGRLTGVYINASGNQNASITITIDGTTVISNNNMAYNAPWILAPDGRILQVTSGLAQAYAGASFNQSLVITANTNASGGSVTVNVAYELEQ